jgi:CHAD domain-containing protein
MAFRLRTDESVRSGLERIVRGELRRAVDQLGGIDLSEEAIHEARKSIKKVRAVLQLVGDDIGANGALKHLRRAGRLLAPLRDADALTDTAKKLCARQHTSLSRAVCATVRERLDERQSRLSGSRRSRRLNKEAAAELRKTQRLAKRWNWGRIDASDLAAEIQRGYKQARRGLERARPRHGANALHSWRKRVKTLWYALRLLPRHTPGITRVIDALERVETALGEDHNLVVLRTRLSRSLNVPGVARVFSLAEQRQHALRRVALTSGERQFSEPPKAFARRVERVLS